MTDDARLELHEYFLEVSLTGRRHVLVEGVTDSRFIRSWLSTLSDVDHVVVTVVDSINVDYGTLVELGLNEGMRSRVLAVAVRADEEDVDLRAVVDRDTGLEMQRFDLTTILWTDFPSLESYCLTEPVFELANLVHFGERFSVPELLHGLEYALGEIFALRMEFPHLPKPNISAGFDRRRPNLKDFDVSKAVGGEARAKAKLCVRPSSSDRRDFAYGHDIAALLMAIEANYFKNSLGLFSVEALEGVLRMTTLAEGSFQSEAMFVALRGWVGSAL